MIPNLFSKKPIPDTIPKELEKIILQLKKTKTQEECLRKAYDIVTAKYHGARLKTYIKLFYVWKWHIDDIWRRKGFLHCTNINYLLRVLLVKSGKFTDEDIEMKITQLAWFSIHQYVHVRVGKKYIDVDPWTRFLGIPFGDHGQGFKRIFAKSNI